MSTTTASPLPWYRQIDWLGMVPFFAMHLGCLAVFWVGWSWTALAVAFVVYAVRGMALTGFYHRYFAHKAFQTSRWFQFLWAFIGCAAAQRGPIWWAAHHRDHHSHSDEPEDEHSPIQHTFLWSHMGWFMTEPNAQLRVKRVPDLMKFPELVFINKYDGIAVLTHGLLMYGLGWALQTWAPQLGVTAWQMFVWGFLISTVFLYHVTYCINSLAHVLGRRRFITTDHSRNNWLLALFAFGEGWHNNHHYYPASARNGFYWWEVDVTYYMIWTFEKLGLVWNVKPVPEKVLELGRTNPAHGIPLGTKAEADQPTLQTPVAQS
ncbi:MAG: acyl-CoA desaturase [Planctomycetota bacterium]|nr:acyl-CoA desaturase [Planctomycetota bacterium]